MAQNENYLAFAFTVFTMIRAQEHTPTLVHTHTQTLKLIHSSQENGQGWDGFAFLLS